MVKKYEILKFGSGLKIRNYLVLSFNKSR